MTSASACHAAKRCGIWTESSFAERGYYYLEQRTVPAASQRSGPFLVELMRFKLRPAQQRTNAEVNSHLWMVHILWGLAESSNSHARTESGHILRSDFHGTMRTPTPRSRQGSTGTTRIVSRNLTMTRPRPWPAGNTEETILLCQAPTIAPR